MNVVLFSPWDNAWVPYFKRAYEARGHAFRHSKTDDVRDGDVYLHGWATGNTSLRPWAKNYVFLRRFELFTGGLSKIDWPRVSGLIVVNSWIKKVVEEMFSEKGIDTPVHLIYNGTDLDKWTWQDRKPGRMIGMACHVHAKKNLPLALQIMAALPDDYELHIAGEVQDGCVAEYLNDLGHRLRRKVYIYGHVPHAQLSGWWEQMNYCLSTSISEGNPNNVIEAMAKGIKPVVHAWPGAEDQFDKYVFETVAEAVEMITGDYDSSAYRQHVVDGFSLKNIDRVVELTL